MAREEAINLLKQYIDYNNPDVPDFYTMEEACEVVIKALEQEPCEDATLKDIFCMGCEYKEQEQKIGHWIETDMYDESVYKCSCCGESYCMEYGSPEEYGYIYCPCCGAKMKEGD